MELARVGRTKDIKAVTMIGGDDDEGVVELADLLEVGHDRSNGIIELKEVTKCSIGIEDMHLFVD